ncbi:hypothetical protein K466DRAFT_220290 [Polyporus arcularius HHB13444]|uniref:Uncharacterized protein n=1 Tax=Polyporus arcularius HHB13444 TaxID=1314778 RepID=A0A5C3P5U6_9APHY|nr:hypothetical protein K466DRAFT_220290 [Polyporus arcularius HHB13444]
MSLFATSRIAHRAASLPPELVFACLHTSASSSLQATSSLSSQPHTMKLCDSPIARPAATFTIAMGLLHSMRRAKLRTLTLALPCRTAYLPMTSVGGGFLPGAWLTVTVIVGSVGEDVWSAGCVTFMKSCATKDGERF